MSSNPTSIQNQFFADDDKRDDESIYEFDRFTLTASTLMLYENDEPVALAPKVVQTLLLLVHRRGEIVSKSELMAQLWTDSFVEEANLTQNIYILRKTLGKGPDGTEIIETFRRRGYKFTPSVTTRGSARSEPTPRRANLTTVLAIAALGLLIAATAAAIYIEHAGSDSAGKNAIALKRLTPDADIHYASISPDGKRVVFSKRENRADSVWLMDIASRESTRILAPNASEGYGGVYFSADGASVLYATTRRGVPNTIINFVSLDGGSSREVARNVISPIAVSPDGLRIAFVNGDGDLSVAEINGFGERVLKSRKGSGSWFESWGSQLSFAPDGRSIAICGGHLDGGRRRVALTEIALDDGAERDVAVPDWNYLDSVQWIPDGSGMMVIAKEESGEPFQIWKIDRRTGAAMRITHDLVDYKSVSIAADSRQMIATQRVGNLNLWLVSPDERRPARQITSAPAANDGFHGVEFAPDGKIVYTSPRSGSNDLWSIAADGSDQTQLTANSGANINPSVSSDGRVIYFLSDRDRDGWSIWRMSADGSEQRRLTRGAIDDRPIASTDGAWVYFVRMTGGGGVVMKIPSDGGEPIAVTREGNFGLLGVSPDGRLLAVRSYDETAAVAWRTGLIDAETGAVVRMFDPRVYGRVAFTPDGKSVIFTYGKESRDLWRLALDGGEPTPLSEFGSGYVRNFDVSSDGQTIVVSRGNPSLEAVLITEF